MASSILTLVLAAAVSGPWSLTECIDYALQNNIQVKQREISVAQREIELNSAENNWLPGVSASAGENFSFGRGLNEDNTYSTGSNTASTRFSVGADMTLFQGLDGANGIKLGKLNLAAAMSDLERAQDDIRVSVAQAYVQILYDQELLVVANNQVDIDEQLFERVKALRETGKASAAEVAAQQSTLAQSRLRATQAENTLKLSILDLSQLLELESPEGFSIVTPMESALEMPLLPSPEDIYAQAIQEKAVVTAEQIRLEAAEVSIRKAKSAYYPSLSLSGGVSTDYFTNSAYSSDPFGKQLKKNFSPYVGLSLRVPIFNRMSTRNSVRNAQLSYNNQQLQLESVKKTLYKEIQQAYYNAVAAQSQLTSSKEAADSAEHSFNLTREKYENGMSSITEYNESKNRYLEAASNYLQARYKCVFQTKLLDFYRGADLSF